MRMILLLGGLVLILAFAGCLRAPARADFAIADGIIAANNKRLAKEGLECFGSGGAFPGTIRLISLSFNTKKYKFDSIEEARIFICRLFRDYARPFNEEKRIRPYLYRFPVDTSMLELSVFFQDEAGCDCSPPYLAYVQCAYGQIRYCQYNSKTQGYVLVYQEPFDKGWRIAEGTTETARGSV